MSAMTSQSPLPRCCTGSQHKLALVFTHLQLFCGSRALRYKLECHDLRCPSPSPFVHLPEAPLPHELKRDECLHGQASFVHPKQENSVDTQAMQGQASLKIKFGKSQDAVGWSDGCPTWALTSAPQLRHRAHVRRRSSAGATALGHNPSRSTVLDNLNSSKVKQHPSLF